MKLTALSLCFYISLLMAQPLLTQLNLTIEDQIETSCDANCCKTSEFPKKQDSKSTNDSKDCCPNGICNPFEQCACCPGVTLEQTFSQFVSSIIYDKQIIWNSSQIISTYVSDCFHPPELV